LISILELGDKSCIFHGKYGLWGREGEENKMRKRLKEPKKKKYTATDLEKLGLKFVYDIILGGSTNFGSNGYFQEKAFSDDK